MLSECRFHWKSFKYIKETQPKLKTESFLAGKGKNNVTD